MKIDTLRDSLLRKVTVSYAVVADCPWRPWPLAQQTQRNIPMLFAKVIWVWETQVSMCQFNIWFYI